MRLLLEDTMALIVDYQERLMPVIYEHDELEKKSCTLLKGLRTLGRSYGHDPAVHKGYWHDHSFDY